MATDVFLSVGRAATAEQEAFVSAVEECLRDQGLNPVGLGRNEWSSVQPLHAIRRLMDKCSGTVIVAFERLHIAQGTDRPGSADSKPLQGESLPTVWNQIEAAMAHTLGHPLLVIVERGLRSEGLLEARYDWMVQWMPLVPEELRTRQSQGIIADWKESVELFQPPARAESAAPAKEDPSLGKMGIPELLGELKAGHAWGAVFALGGMLFAAFIAGAQIS
jgi:hypothetical protein